MDLSGLQTLEWQGRGRTYAVEAPAGPGGAPRAAVIVLHGGGTNAENAARMSEMAEKARSEGFLAVFPNGTGVRPNVALTWNAGHCCGWAREKEVDDVGFLSALIAELVAKHCADPDRIYMTGFSNGAMMAHRFACDRAEQIAAIAPVAGTIPFAAARPSRPVPALLIHGDEDEYAPYAGGTGARTLFPRVDIPAGEAARFWARTNGCAPEPGMFAAPGYFRETWSGGREGSEAILYTMVGQGHAWPGGRPGVRNGNIDPPSDKLRATDVIWEFFRKHTRKEAHARR